MAVALVGAAPVQAAGVSGANGVIAADLTISPKVPSAPLECVNLTFAGPGVGEIHIAGSTTSEVFAAFGGVFTFSMSGASTACETVQLGAGNVTIHGCQNLLVGIAIPDATLNPTLSCELNGNYTRVGTKVVATLTGWFTAGSHTWNIGPVLPLVVNANFVVTSIGSPSTARLAGKFWNTTVS